MMCLSTTRLDAIIKECEQFAPKTSEQAAGQIKAHLLSGRPVIPCGNMSRLQNRLGNRCGEAAIISTRKMIQIESFEKKNLSLTVQAGASLEMVQKAASRVGTFLPITLEDYGLRSIGSLVAEGAKGYEAYAFGSLKEYLLGVRFITPCGDITAAGGKTVKNVAGYDLTRLLWRSAGTLGLITAVTFRLLPCIAIRKTVLAEVPDLSAAVKLAEDVRKAGLCLLTLMAFGVNSGNGVFTWYLIVGLGGFAKTVDVHCKRLKKIINPLPLTFFSEDERITFWQDYCESGQSQKKYVLKGRGDRKALYTICPSVAALAGKVGLSKIEIDFGWPGFSLYFSGWQHLEKGHKILSMAMSATGRFTTDYPKAPAGVIYRQMKQHLDPANFFFPEYLLSGKV